MAGMTFTKSVANPDRPQGQVATRLREIVADSPIRSSEELKRLTNYAGSTLSEVMGGRKRQTPGVVIAIVRACISDRVRADAEIEKLVAILERGSDVSGAEEASVVERRPYDRGSMDSSFHEDPDDAWAEPGAPDRSTARRRMGRIKTLSRRRPRLLALGMALMLLVLAGAGYGIYQAASGCGSGVALVQGECVGLSDGSVPILADEPSQLTRVRELIHLENVRVLADSRPWVSTAYLFPWAASDTLDAGDQFAAPALLHELEGAYVAQRQANATSIFGRGPQLRLLLGNLGRAATQYQHVVSDLTDRVASDGGSDSDHIVAVVMTGKSVRPALEAIDQITALGLPVLTTQMTSDGIQGDSPDRSVTRIAPTVNDGVQALAGYLHPPSSGAVLVQSLNGSDSYSQSLAQAFSKYFPGAIESKFVYDPSVNVQDMSTVVGNLCDSPGRDVTVFFAGRSSELSLFIEALPGRMSCQSKHLTIATGSDAIDTANAVAQSDTLIQNALRAGLAANATLYYTGITSPQAWFPPFVTPASSPPLLAADFPSLFPTRDLDDGAAIIGSDAVQTVVSTVRFQPNPSIAGNANDTPARVAQVLHQRTGRYAIPLASGTLSIGPDGQPQNRAVPIIQVLPSGESTLATLATPNRQSDH